MLTSQETKVIERKEVFPVEAGAASTVASNQIGERPVFDADEARVRFPVLEYTN